MAQFGGQDRTEGGQTAARLGGWLQAPPFSEENTEASVVRPLGQGHTAGQHPGAGLRPRCGPGQVIGTSGREARGPEAGAPAPGSRCSRNMGSPSLRFSALSASLSTCSGVPTRPSPDAFFGAPCVFTRRQPASPNLTLPSARMLALRLPWGRLLAPGSELRCAPPWGTSFSRVGYLHISPGSILSGATSTNVLISQSSCFS